MEKHWLEEIFEKWGVFLKGHFVLNSGRHSKQYLEVPAIFSDIEASFNVCYWLARQISEECPERKIEVVAGPATGGIVVAREVARALEGIYGLGQKVIPVYTEKNKKKKHVFQVPGYKKLIKGKRVLIVDDVLTSGDTISQLIEQVREAEGEIVAIGVLCDRSRVVFAYELISLWQTKIETWTAKNCPLCKEGVPIDKIK